MKSLQSNYLYLFVFIMVGFVRLPAQQLNYDKISKEFALKSIPTLREYLALPCDANFKEDILKNVDWVERQFTLRGFSAKRLETSTIPVLLLQKSSTNPSAKTIMFYFHSDGQPVNPSEWKQADPFIPVLKAQDPKTKEWKEIPFESLQNDYNPEWRIFARAASDDKSPGIMLMTAIDALKSQNINANYHIKILVDFEEEKGSVNLPSIIKENIEVLKSDLLLILDGPAHDSNLPTLSFGARGILTVTLTTFGAYSDLHSGHYGNYVSNPAWNMVKLLSTMKSEDGKVLVQGFYDGIKIDKATKAYLKSIPDNIPELHKRLGIKATDKVGESYREALMYPSLNIRGLKSGGVADKAGTIVPERAITEIDIRTVTQSHPDSLLRKLKSHITKQGYHIIDGDPTPEQRAKYAKIISLKVRPPYGAFSSDVNGPMAKWLEKAISKTSTEKVLKLPLMGGSLPISPFVSLLKVEAITLPTVNSDNNQHSFDENLRLGNYVNGIKMLMGVLSTEF